MTRRVILGWDGSSMKFRVSKPGADAATADLDDLLFDADSVPAVVKGSGAFNADFNAFQQTQPEVAEVTTISHGAGSNVDLIMAIAEPTDGRSGAGIWAHWYRTSPTAAASQSIGNGTMNNRHCTPFWFKGDLGTGVVYWGGWRYTWNSTSITITNNLANALRVRWVALEF